MTRNLEKRPGAGNGSPSRNSGGSNRVVSRSTAGKRSPPTPENIDRKIASSRSAAKDEKPNGSIGQAHPMNQLDSAPAQSEQETGVTNNTALAAPGGIEKVNNAEVIEWPRIYVALSRKEKEDDFFAMKGTKLPQRPKKRAKNVDKTLQVLENIVVFLLVFLLLIIFLFFHMNPFDILSIMMMISCGLCLLAVLFSRDVAF